MSFFFFSSRRRHTRCGRDWSSDVCSSDLPVVPASVEQHDLTRGREMLDIPPEVPLAALPFGRRRECGDTREARVEVLADPLDRAPLAGRVPPLEDDHYPGALRAYPFLQLDQLALQPEQLRLVDLLRQTLDPRIPGHRPSHSRPPPSRRALDVTVVRPRRHGGRRVLQQRRRIATGLRRRTTGVEELFPGPVLA